MKKSSRGCVILDETSYWDVCRGKIVSFWLQSHNGVPTAWKGHPPLPSSLTNSNRTRQQMVKYNPSSSIHFYTRERESVWFPGKASAIEYGTWKECVWITTATSCPQSALLAVPHMYFRWSKYAPSKPNSGREVHWNILILRLFEWHCFKYFLGLIASNKIDNVYCLLGCDAV